MRGNRIILVGLLLVIALAFIGYELAAADRSISGAVIYRLPARCELIYFDTSLQPVQTLALACSQKDMTRLWPLPVQSPWFEDRLSPAEDNFSG